MFSDPVQTSSYTVPTDSCGWNLNTPSSSPSVTSTRPVREGDADLYLVHLSAPPTYVREGTRREPTHPSLQVFLVSVL